MTVKELIERLLELPVPVDKAEVKFENSQLLVFVNKEESGEAYIIS